MINTTIRHILKLIMLPLFIVLPAKAGIIMGTINMDTSTNLSVTWAGKGVFDDGLDNDSLGIAGLTNWTISSPTVLTYLGGGAGWTGMMSASHTSSPHGEAGNGDTATFALNFDQLFDTNATINKGAAHIPHKDSYRFDYTYVTSTDSFTARLTGIHTVPEPSTLAIFALGIIGLASRYVKKQS